MAYGLSSANAILPLPTLSSYEGCPTCVRAQTIVFDTRHICIPNQSQASKQHSAVGEVGPATPSLSDHQPPALIRAGGYGITSRGPERLLGNDGGPPQLPAPLPPRGSTAPRVLGVALWFLPSFFYL